MTGAPFLSCSRLCSAGRGVVSVQSGGRQGSRQDLPVASKGSTGRQSRSKILPYFSFQVRRAVSSFSISSLSARTHSECTYLVNKRHAVPRFRKSSSGQRTADDAIRERECVVRHFE